MTNWQILKLFMRYLGIIQIQLQSFCHFLTFSAKLLSFYLEERTLSNKRKASLSLWFPRKSKHRGKCKVVGLPRFALIFVFTVQIWRILKQDAWLWLWSYRITCINNCVPCQEQEQTWGGLGLVFYMGLAKAELAMHRYPDFIKMNANVCSVLLGFSAAGSSSCLNAR